MSGTRKRGRPVVNPASLPLLTLLGRLRCASYGHLKTLLCGSTSDHDLAKSIECLFDDGLLQIIALPHGRHGYALTPRAIRGVPALQAQFKASRATVSDRAGVQGWQRAALWAHFTRVGALVLSGKAAVGALRENRLVALERVEGASPSSRNELRQRIEDCLPPQKEDLSVDVARAPDGMCTLLVADDPYSRILTQLEELPVAISAYDRDTASAVYLAPLPVVFVPSDEESRWDDAQGTWAARGPRLRQWQGYVSDSQPHEGFPYCKVLVDVAPPPQAILYRRQAPRRTFSRVTATPRAASAGTPGEPS